MDYIPTLMTARGMRECRAEDLPDVGGFLLYGFGFGDILCMTPMIDEAVRVLGRDLDVWSLRPEVFQFHPRVRSHQTEKLALQEYLESGKVLLVSPLGSGNDRYDSHLIEQSARGVIDLPPERRSLRFFSSLEARRSIEEKVSALPRLPRIVIHPSNGSPIRTWPEERWRELARALSEDFVVIAVGQELDHRIPGSPIAKKEVFSLRVPSPRFLDWTNSLSLHELYELIAASDCVVTVDSGVLHVANATQTPIVAMFTHVAPECRTRLDEKGNPGLATVSVVLPCEFQFCSTRHGSGGCRFEGRDFLKCLPSASEVARAVRGAFRLEKSNRNV